MKYAKFAVLLLVLALASACGGGPTAANLVTSVTTANQGGGTPTITASPTTAVPQSSTIRVVDLLSNEPIGGVEVRYNGQAVCVTISDGTCTPTVNLPARAYVGLYKVGYLGETVGGRHVRYGVDDRPSERGTYSLMPVAPSQGITEEFIRNYWYGFPTQGPLFQPIGPARIDASGLSQAAQDNLRSCLGQIAACAHVPVSMETGTLPVRARVDTSLGNVSYAAPQTNNANIITSSEVVYAFDHSLGCFLDVHEFVHALRSANDVRNIAGDSILGMSNACTPLDESMMRYADERPPGNTFPDDAPRN